MKLFKGVFDFYLDASIHVAFSVLALVWISVLNLNIPVNAHLNGFLFFGTVVCYNFVKYGVEAKKYLLVASRYHKNIQVFSFFAAVPMFYHAYFLSYEIWLGIGVLGLISALYAIPVLPRTKNLRSWGGFKIFIVALVWMGATVVLPVVGSGQHFSWDVNVVAFQRFVFVLILLIPFEIRDLKYDDAELRTLPQRYGVGNTKAIGYFMAFVFLLALFVREEASKVEVVSEGVIFLVFMWLLYATKRDQSRYFSSFWVEAIPMAWYLLLRSLYWI